MNLWSLAVFYDTPLNKEKGTAFNAYGGYFHTYYGPGYLPVQRDYEPATGTTTPGARRKSRQCIPMFGTGNVFMDRRVT